MKTRTFVCLVAVISSSAFAQGVRTVSAARLKAVTDASRLTFPKFYSALASVNSRDPLVTDVIFVEQDFGSEGPSSTSRSGVIRINIDFLEHPRPDEDDNRMLLHLYHEVGHLHYFATHSPRNSDRVDGEKAAFEYALAVAKKLADKGDCGPLASGIKFQKLASQGLDAGDPHVRALKQIVSTPEFVSDEAYVSEHCSAVEASLLIR